MNYLFFRLESVFLWLWFIAAITILIAILVSNKLVLYEYRAIFAPLWIRHKGKFVISLILLTVWLIVIVLWGIEKCYSYKRVFNANAVSITLGILGLCFTAFFGVIVVLQTSTNNIGRLLSRVSGMFNTTNKLYIILPTPFLGYHSYRRHYKRIEQYLIKSTTSAGFSIAFLDWEKGNRGATGYENYATIKTALEKELKTQQECYENIRGISFRNKKKNPKGGAWEKFSESSSGTLPDLFQFHFDEIQKEKISNGKKYDYFIALCDAIEKIVAKQSTMIEVKKINITYSFDETVFPIILINSNDKKILHGTTRIESQLKVRFEGDTITDDKLCGKANDIFQAYTT